jgi:hypothetical protein
MKLNVITINVLTIDVYTYVLIRHFVSSFVIHAPNRLI